MARRSKPTRKGLERSGEVARKLSAMPEEFLECREAGHAWKFTTDTMITRNARGDIIQFTRFAWCRDCHAERNQVITVPDFTVRTSTIRYPEGYLLHGMHARRADAREVVFHRLKVAVNVTATTSKKK